MRMMRRVHHLSRWLRTTDDVHKIELRFNWPLKFALFNCRTRNAPTLIRELPPGWRDEKQTSVALQFPFPLHPHLLLFSSSLPPLLSRMQPTILQLGLLTVRKGKFSMTRISMKTPGEWSEINKNNGECL